MDVVAGGPHPPEIGPVFSPRSDGSAGLVARFTSLVTLPASIAHHSDGLPSSQRSMSSMTSAKNAS